MLRITAKPTSAWACWVFCFKIPLPCPVWLHVGHSWMPEPREHAFIHSPVQPSAYSLGQ